MNDKVEIESSFSKNKETGSEVVEDSDDESRVNKSDNFNIRKGCCRECMKAFSKSGKSCLCQVPMSQRKFSLPDKGCNFCNCMGCNPIDVRKRQRKEMKNEIFKQDKDLRAHRILDSDDEDIPTNFRESEEYNKYRSELESLLSTYLNPKYSGFGYPKRTSTYILGYNPKDKDTLSFDWKNHKKYIEREKEKNLEKTKTDKIH